MKSIDPGVQANSSSQSETVSPARRTCTWSGCHATAVQQQWDRQGNQWADLCAEHETAMRASMTSCDVKQIVSSWVKAQGGAKAAMERV